MLLNYKTDFDSELNPISKIYNQNEKIVLCLTWEIYLNFLIPESQEGKKNVPHIIEFALLFYKIKFSKSIYISPKAYTYNK